MPEILTLIIEYDDSCQVPLKHPEQILKYKKMKTNFLTPILIFACFLFSNTRLVSQGKPAGVYLSASDYTRDKISYAGTTDKKNRICINGVFYKSFIKIKSGDSLIKLDKQNIFGYTDKNGGCYRFYNGETYPIINPREGIILYRVNARTVKGMNNTPEWFFSKDASSPVLPLTLANMKSAFSGNAAFIDVLETSFSKDDELNQYDSYFKKYRINKLFENTITR